MILLTILFSYRFFGAIAGGLFIISNFISTNAFADDQHKVETAFIYQFTNYIQWPGPPSEENFVISVVGNTPLVEQLQEMAKVKTAKGRKIEIQQVQEVNQIKSSDIIIIGTANERHLEEAIKKAKTESVLVISASKGFASKGSMINFFVDDGRIRFEINRGALENAKLQASSQLLKLAKLVD